MTIVMRHRETLQRCPVGDHPMLWARGAAECPEGLLVTYAVQVLRAEWNVAERHGYTGTRNGRPVMLAATPTGGTVLAEVEITTR
jgi:hypothetical protein